MLELDVHGYTELEAKKIIERYIASLPKDIKELRIIHGYHGGDSLRSLVRDNSKLRSKRIKRRKMTMNQGETIIELF